MNDDLTKQAKEIAAAIWALKDELQKTNNLLERVTGREENLVRESIYFIRTLDIGRGDD